MACAHTATNTVAPVRISWELSRLDSESWNTTAITSRAQRISSEVIGMRRLGFG